MHVINIRVVLEYLVTHNCGSDNSSVYFLLSNISLFQFGWLPSALALVRSDIICTFFSPWKVWLLNITLLATIFIINGFCVCFFQYFWDFFGYTFLSKNFVHKITWAFLLYNCLFSFCYTEVCSLTVTFENLIIIDTSIKLFVLNMNGGHFWYWLFDYISEDFSYHLFKWPSYSWNL